MSEAAGEHPAAAIWIRRLIGPAWAFGSFLTTGLILDFASGRWRIRGWDDDAFALVGGGLSLGVIVIASRRLGFRACAGRAWPGLYVFGEFAAMGLGFWVQRQYTADIVGALSGVGFFVALLYLQAWADSNPLLHFRNEVRDIWRDLVWLVGIVDTALGLVAGIVVCLAAIFFFGLAANELAAPSGLSASIAAGLPRSSGLPLPPALLVRAGCAAFIGIGLVAFWLAARSRRSPILMWSGTAIGTLFVARLAAGMFGVEAPAPVAVAEIAGVGLAVAALCLFLRNRAGNPWD